MVQSELLVKEHDSNTLNTNNAKYVVLFYNSISIGEQGQIPNRLEIVDNGIVLSSLSLQNPVGRKVSIDHENSLNKNDQNEEENYYKGPAANKRVIVISRYVHLYDLVFLFLVDSTYYFLFLFS